MIEDKWQIGRAMRLAAEQLREVAQGASPGNAMSGIVKLRSSDVYLRILEINVAALQLFGTKVTMTCGFTAGYRPPLLRSESHMDHQSTDAPATGGGTGFACACGSPLNLKTSAPVLITHDSFSKSAATELQTARRVVGVCRTYDVSSRGKCCVAELRR